jgi:outer membrane lipoprotein-sorting protein
MNVPEWPRRRGTLGGMSSLLWVTILASMLAGAQGTDDAMALLRKAESIADTTNNWRADVVERFQTSGRGMNLQDEVHIKIAAQAQLKVRRENSDGDQTVLVCDGAKGFYSGDGHSYYRISPEVTPDCNLPLSRFYQLRKDPASVSIVGRDHVSLADGDRACEVIRAEWKLATVHIVRTMCIDPTSGLILRDVAENEDEGTGMRSVVTTTFSSYESNPTLTPDAFKFSIPPGAVEAKPPN